MAPSWARLGSLLGFIWAPSGALFWLNFGPSRLLSPYLFKNVNVHETLCKKSPKMIPRRHPRRPKIDPRRLQDDLQELLFSTSFLTSIWVCFCSHFGSHVGSLFGAKSTPYLHHVELKTTKIAVCVHVRMNFTLCTFVCISLFSLCARLCKIRTHMHAHTDANTSYESNPSTIPSY